MTADRSTDRTDSEVRTRLPNLVVIGVPKAGTGSLFSSLAQHPEICPASTKEIGYFTPLRTPGGTLPPAAEYASYFSACDGQRFRLEATPSYCFGGAAVRDAIGAVLGDPRLVLILRDPVDRLWSAYTFQRSLGNVREAFAEYVRRCEDEYRSGGELRPGSHYNGLGIGFYADYVPQWIDAFGSNMRVVFFDDLRADAASVVRGLWTWLGLDAAAVDAFDASARNRTITPRSGAAARAFALARRAGRALPSVPRVRSAARAAYFRVNAGGAARERISDADAARMREMYAPSNAAVAARLRSAGYASLPAWLANAAQSD